VVGAIRPDDRVPNVVVLPTREELWEAAAERFVSAAAESVRRRGRFTVALSGGATPNGLYALLATKAFRTRVSWHDAHVFWGDERCVPPDDPRSNYRAAYELLLSHVPIPAANVHRLRGEAEPHEGAADGEAELRAHFMTPTGAPRFAGGACFDLVLLGLGTDGHTASLFPDGVALTEGSRWVVADYAASVGMWRLTLTLPVINAARDVLFLVSGTEKRGTAARVLNAPDNAARLPAGLVHPVEGRMTWLLDSAASPFPSPN
jgi:6-phosphogluconolactonase